MDLLLNFKNKNYDAKYHESFDPYLRKVLKTNFAYMITVLPFFPYSEYVVIKISVDTQAEIIRAAFISVLYAFLIINSIIILKLKPLISRHQKLTRWAFDIFYCVFGAYFAYHFWVYSSNAKDPISNYIVGWMASFMAFLMVGPISRWYLKLATYLVIILRIGSCAYIIEYSSFILLKVIQIVLMEILVVYLGERDKRKHFIEKQLLFEETTVYKDIFELATDTFAIYGLKEGLLFHNWTTNEKCRWRNSERSLEQNFGNIHITGYKKIAKLPPNIELDLESVVNTSSQSNFWVFLQHLTQQLSPYPICPQNSQTAHGETLKPGYLMLLTGRVDQSSPDHIPSSTNYLLEIKIMLTIFREKPSVVLVFSDITERNLVTVLQENNNYKDRLLASVSHELRTPLNASINFTEAAIEHPALHALPDVRDNYLMPALRSSQVLLHIINDILDFSQMTANKLRLVYENKNVVETLNECVNLLKIQTMRKGLKLSLDFSSEDGKDEFCTDHNRLKQIILNLLSNALKFTLKGEINVTAKITLPKDLPIGGRVSGTEVFGYRALSVKVSDTGIGISRENKQKLFRAFEKIELGDRLPLNSQGVGLGLVISNNLVLALGPEEQNNGMKVESTENEGSTFLFWIVDKTQEELKVNQSGSESANICIEIDEHNGDDQEHRLDTVTSFLPKKTMDLLNSERKNNLIQSTEASLPPSARLIDTNKYPRILIVDDDIFNIFALQMILSKLGYTCDTAFNGEQAIQKVLERGVANAKSDACKSIQYKLIFMDWSMPIMDGSEATMILKKKMRNREIDDIAIVACTAFWSEKEKVHASEAGIDAFCFKPINKELVSNLVKKFVPSKC